MIINFNVSGSRRKELVQAIADFLQVHPVYLGAPTFAYEIGGCQVDANGVHTTPNTGGVATAALLDELKQKGFHSVDGDEAAIPSTSTESPREQGLPCMVEIPRVGFTPEAEDRLHRIVASKATLLKKALGTDSLEILKTEDTYQFPWFTLYDIEGEVEAYHRLICAICKMAKEQKRVTAKEQPTDNEKFSMRMFLIRLGFVGKEYKLFRKILLRNLSGNSSWKSGHRLEPAETANTELTPNTSEAETPATETTPAENSVEAAEEHPNDSPTDDSADTKGGAPYVQE